MKNQPEYHLQVEICQWLRYQFSEVLFLSDTVASCKLTMPQAVRNKKIQCAAFSCPDILIFQPNKLFHGMALELKIKSPYKKDGSLYSDTHLEEQAATIKRLNELGYMASFCWSFEQAKELITDYMKIK